MNNIMEEPIQLSNKQIVHQIIKANSKRISNMTIRLQSMSYLTGLAVLGTVILFFYVFLLHYVHNGHNSIPDPESPIPPSSMPMGLYNKIGVVSNGGPCAQIGVDVMLKGGNAVDAAVATMLCDGALCPEYMGIGGGFLMSIYNATTKKVMTIDARETAPAGATPSMFVEDPSKSIDGGMAVAVPGELKGYSTIYNLYGGGVSWESLFEPTIKLCEEGMTISKRLAINLNNHEDLIKYDVLLRKAFFDEKTGHVKTAGEQYNLPELAKTLEMIANEGIDAIYNGSLTTIFLDDLKEVGGIITREDLASYTVEIKESFPVNLKSGHTIHVGPPPSSGIILAFILRILDGILPTPDIGLDAHQFVEAFKFGFGERTHLGDHKFVDVSQVYDKVRSDSFINSIQSKISNSSTSSDPRYYGAIYDLPENHGTANIVVTDSKGNTVVATSTLNTYFGSGFISPRTGILLNNQMDDFSTPGVINFYGIPSSPANFIEPGKRPMSSMCPTIFTDKNGDFVLGVGAAGGSKITPATAYVSAFKLWYNNTLKEVVDKPRIYHQLIPMEVQYEYGTTEDIVQKLMDIGHPVIRLENGASAVTAIARTSTGMIEAMPDFRRPGNSSGI